MLILLMLISKRKRNPYAGILLLSLLRALFHPVHRVTFYPTTTTTITTTTQVIPSHLIASYPVLSFMYRRLSHD
jgi:H+/gluconate symporter-like permease